VAKQAPKQEPKQEILAKIPAHQRPPERVVETPKQPPNPSTGTNIAKNDPKASKIIGKTCVWDGKLLGICEALGRCLIVVQGRSDSLVRQHLPRELGLESNSTVHVTHTRPALSNTCEMENTMDRLEAQSTFSVPLAAECLQHRTKSKSSIQMKKSNVPQTADFVREAFD
jgi:hypothetical protein